MRHRSFNGLYVPNTTCLSAVSYVLFILAIYIFLNLTLHNKASYIKSFMIKFISYRYSTSPTLLGN